MVSVLDAISALAQAKAMSGTARKHALSRWALSCHCNTFAFRKSLIFQLLQLIFSAHRLHDFNVGLVEREVSYGETIDPASYPLCTHYTGAVPSGATVILDCDYSGAALVVLIQIPGTNERLTLCEVQVEAVEITSWFS